MRKKEKNSMHFGIPLKHTDPDSALIFALITLLLSDGGDDLLIMALLYVLS